MHWLRPILSVFLVAVVAVTFIALLSPNDAHSQTQPAFDHFTTGFRLDGMHQFADCEACHNNGLFTGTPTSCYDCHSHETRWPWYAFVAPVSWMVAHDVTDAREELNFSTWRAYRPDQRERLREKMLEEVEEGEMPPRLYRLLHPDAELDATELELLRAWAADGAGR